MTEEESKVLVESVVTKYCGEHSEAKSVSVSNVVNTFLRRSGKLLINKELIKDTRSIPAMYWRGLGVNSASDMTTEELLVKYVEVMEGRSTRYNRLAVQQDSSTGSLRIDFTSTRTSEYSNIYGTVPERMDSYVIAGSPTDSIELWELPGDSGDYYEESDDMEYHTENSELEDSEDEEVSVESATYTDSRGEDHDLDVSEMGYDSEYLSAQVEEIEDGILAETAQEEADAEEEDD